MPDVDWRDALLRDLQLSAVDAGGGNPLGWPGYEPRPALRWGEGPVAGHRVVACVWDFTAYGGTFGTAEAATFAVACDRAATARLPLVSFVRTGGTRLQEGVAALVGIPRAALALDQLAAAQVPHVAVVDHPTTGGIWVVMSTLADLRVAVSGATVGFTGPRVVEAMTGEPVPAGSHTADGALAAGLVDAAVPGEQVGPRLAATLRALAPDTDGAVEPPPAAAPPTRGGWEQVRAAREQDRPDGGTLLDALLDDPVELRGGDASVRAVLGRSAAGRRTVGVALAARHGGRPTPAGYALFTRATRLADRLGADLLTLVDTPGADPTARSEAAGVAPAIGAAMVELLRCRSATLAVVHGEGGSGGALAGAVADEVLVTESGYFAALGPEGAGSALRVDAATAADRMAVTPADLHRLGFAEPASGAVEPLRRDVAVRLRALAGQEPASRQARRRHRWSSGVPGSL